MREIRLVRRNNSNQAVCLFECFCGALFEAQRYKVRIGHTRSCGCLKLKLLRERSVDHGHCIGPKVSPTYVSWSRMKYRCMNPKSNRFEQYGGRGIVVCDEWMSFDNFLADMGLRPSTEYSIDRIDPDGNYEPGNCRWVLKSDNTSRRFHSNQ